MAEKLHNTSSVCKSNYIDPVLIDKYMKNPHNFVKHYGNNLTAENLTDRYKCLNNLKHVKNA